VKSSFSCLAAVLLTACNGTGQVVDRRAPDVFASQRTAAISDASYVDSAIPIEEALRRFRKDLPLRKTLLGGLDSRNKLVRAFVRAINSSDTVALRRLALRADEFAWLYYPSSPLSQPPYELSPALMWFQLQGESERGASRLLAERAGGGLRYVGHTCAPPRQEGTNRLHPECELRYRTVSGETRAERLFGLIIERDGLYKFVSYANRLD
jgi:hypothetical protein